jgi:Putative Ig domain
MRSHGLAMMALIVFGLGLGCGGGGSDITGTQTTTPSPALAITSGPPPSGSVGTSYAGNGFSLSASGGTAPYQWSWTAAAGSSLPTGLKISTSGLISGTPQVASTYAITVQVTDSSSPAVQVNANYSIDIAGTPALTITSDAPPDGAVGVNYGATVTESFKCFWSPVLGWHQVCTQCPSSGGSCSSLPPCRGFSIKPCRETKLVFLGFTFTAAGGVPPYTWSASGMPPGIDVDPSSGKILGTPTMAGSYSIMIIATDSSSSPSQVSATYVIDIN